ncbi:MAG: hypothetical protein JWO86_8781 [Myxococcaceae bacterium]|nr:hypothetical protein [Myxococcaceae bacterium]
MRHLPYARVLLRPALAMGLVAAVACGGSSATVGTSGDLIDAGVDSASGTDASTSTDGAVTPDAFVVPDAAVPDATVDAGPVIHELPAPDCHDLVQQADLVAHVANVSPPPAQVPITTITPGTYILTKATDYDGVTVIDTTSSRTTVAFTPTHQYYLSESNGGAPAQVFTLDWKITNNRLIRTILCTQNGGGVGTMVDYRIDAATNGFIIYVPAPSSGVGGTRTQAFRYTRVP